MRRSLFRPPAVRAVQPRPTPNPQPRRTFLYTSSPWSPELSTTGMSTDASASQNLHPETLPFKFETGYALFAKRAPRPFPPPFLSPPSGSFSDPLSTHHMSRDKRMFVNGNLIRGFTNGDDAVYASEQFICANDGVGAWSTRPGGHAGSVQKNITMAMR